ncbi:ZIP family metal transporter [Aneurinibacillus sp. Ricciae_BoGa-3]|uniref:ZIP family metal transporter n=1 Tax=Aneurinibacillus sp. Ricciae_BoGa-3 TaxID=3022697 RepID=UPI0023415E5C|nr:ZIP family metal transporter [Aneurinibacillus sp. Ricciae_BoGa-3]WCK54360.1 ZIP family metal transporter [Aneurinibacillus sp. Ricciae_BoGa-3]
MTETVFISMMTGLTTLLGSMVILFIGPPGRKLLAFYLGLSAGVMTLVIFVDLLPASLRDEDVYGALLGCCAGVACLMFVHKAADFAQRKTGNGRNDSEGMWRKAGWMMTIAIAMHHIPEGIAIGAGFQAHESIGVMIALSMSLHNIPEGIGFTVPLLMGRIPKLVILLLAFIISLCIPLGAWLGELYFSSTPWAITFGLAFAAGAMAYIVWKEIAPSGLKQDRLSAQAGMLAGLAVMVALHLLEG